MARRTTSWAELRHKPRRCTHLRKPSDLGLPGGPELPASFKQLLEHQDGWRAVHEKWKKDQVPYKSWKAPTPFPKQLQGELEDTIEKLEKRRAAPSKPG